MEGGISLKKFILGVKQELQEASAEGSDNPFLELTQVELETEFSLETSGGVEGGFSFFVKASAEAGASQSHKVKLIFSPILIDNTTMHEASPSSPSSPSSPTDQPPAPASGTSSKRSGKPIFVTIPLVGSTGRHQNPTGVYFTPHVVFDPKMDIDLEEIFKRTLLDLNKPNKKGGGSEDGGV